MTGFDGWGEATQGRPGNTYETLETMDIMVRNYFAPVLVGLDLEDTGTVIAKYHAARYGHPIAKSGGEMTGFLRVGDQDIFSGIPVTCGKAVLIDVAGLGIEVNMKRLAQAAIAVK